MRRSRPSPRTILLIDDDPDLARLLSDTLEARRYRVWHVTTAREAELVLDHTLPDLILLDLILPDRNGLLLCARLREELGVPIIICSGSRRKGDAALGLRLGAADFVAKPFSLDDLQARMEAALRPGPPLGTGAPGPDRLQRLGPLVIDPAACRVTLGGEVLDLTPTEYRLLCAIAARPNQVTSSQELAELIWGAHDSAITQSLAVHMRRLRAKLESAAGPAPRVVTHRGFGYELVDDTAAPWWDDRPRESDKPHYSMRDRQPRPASGS